MVLSSFIYMQLGIALAGLGVVYFLHTRKLKQEAALLLEAWTAAQADSGSDEKHMAWLEARSAALEPKDTPQQIRKVVLDCEGKDPKRLNNQLKPFLGPLSLKDRWTDLRAKQLAAALELFAEQPGRAKTAMDVYSVYLPIDKLLDVAPPEWPTLPDGTVDEVESLRGEVVALKSELEAATAGTDEDLRKLLKQFTQDSREMMGCIQQLEKENLALKTQIEQSAAA